MGLYSRHILPRLVHAACSGRPIGRQRRKVVPLARGRVLEIGIGSGLNLPFYDARQVERVWGLDPAPEMRRLAAGAARESSFEVEVIGLPEGRIPLDRDSVDSVVITYTLCTIRESETALREMARVLRPDGELIFCEHGLAPDIGVRRWQRTLNPVWGLCGGGCSLDRDIPAVLAAGGFQTRRLESGYIPGWRPASFNYWGTAVPH
jgi:SAM-dependent methyltransferase